MLKNLTQIIIRNNNKVNNKEEHTPKHGINFYKKQKNNDILL